MTKYGILFLICRKIKYIFAPKISFPAKEQFPSACVYIGHHQNMYGPVTFMTFCPVAVRLWVFNMFLDKKDCFDQFYNYTFLQRFKINKIVAKICAKILSVFIPALMNSMRSIAVYRLDSPSNMLKTLQDSVDALVNGERVVIFPDIDYTSDEAYTGRLYSGFSRIDKMYFERTNKHIDFIPVYISKAKKKMILGNIFKITDDSAISSKRIAQTMQDDLNALAAECGDI